MRAPAGLDAASRALWALVVDDLKDRGVLREVDGPAVARYVRAEEVARRRGEPEAGGVDPFAAHVGDQLAARRARR